MILSTSFFVVPFLFSAISGAYISKQGNAPCLEHQFTGKFLIGSPLKPIPVQGGKRVVQAIMGGSISGPALNGNITGGVAFPSTFNKGTLQSALITTYGISVDGESFLVQVNGIGTPSDQFASITIEIGGAAATLTKDFILASIHPSADHKIVTVEGYKVSK